MPANASTTLVLSAAVHLLAVASDNTRRMKLTDQGLQTAVQTALDNAKIALSIARVLEKSGAEL